MSGNGVAKVVDSGHPSLSRGDFWFGEVEDGKSILSLQQQKSLLKIPTIDVPPFILSWNSW